MTRKEIREDSESWQAYKRSAARDKLSLEARANYIKHTARAILEADARMKQ